MVKRANILERAELKHERQHPLGLLEKLALFEEMYTHARLTGRLGTGYTKENLEDIIALAKKIHGDISAPPHPHR
jgi:hypothetical protein